MADAAERVLVERHGAVLHIGLNRAEKRNAFDGPMLGALATAFTELERDPELRAGLVWAVGDHFTGGLDLGTVGADLATGGLHYRGTDEIDPWGLVGPARTKPVVVAVQGLCYTLGIELILATDVAVATRDTVFTQLEVARGILPFGGATIRFPARCGWGNAMRWMLTGDRFDADEALRIGLVQQLVDPGTAREAGAVIAERIAAQAPLAVEALLENARLSAASGPADAAAALPGALIALAATDDVAEGLRSFAERRTAVFAGR